MKVEIGTEHLRRCIDNLEATFENMKSLQSNGDPTYETFRTACVKEFEIALELAGGKLLRNLLSDKFISNKETRTFTFNKVIRVSEKHGILSEEEMNRWLNYRVARNETSHKYGVQLTKYLLSIVPAFITDARALADAIDKI